MPDISPLMPMHQDPLLVTSSEASTLVPVEVHRVHAANLLHVIEDQWEDKFYTVNIMVDDLLMYLLIISHCHGNGQLTNGIFIQFQ